MTSSELISKLVGECLAVLDESEPGAMLRLLVREALVALWGAPVDEAAITFVRQLEFAADRVEVLGVGPVAAILSRARPPSTRRRTPPPARSGMRFVVTSGPPASA